MRVTKYGHACLLVEEGDGRVLVDPGSFSSGFEGLTGLTGLLVTHQHADHLDVDRLQALSEANPQAKVYADQASASTLGGRGVDATPVEKGAVLDLGVEVAVVGRDHAVIHPDVPMIPNVGYLFAGRLLHPGDAYTVPEAGVEVLAMPTAAPWLKVSEAVDYLRAVAPRVAVPIHDAVLAQPQVWYRQYENLAPAGTTVRIVEERQPTEV